MTAPGAGPLLVDHDPRLAEQVRRLAGERMVFVAGLPGTGKSLLVHQLAHAVRARRRVTLLQWDVARPVLEASPAGGRYPLAGGVTDPVIRLAAGLWVRQALVAWHERHDATDHILVGELPLVGHRFIELVRRLDDRAEALLSTPSCRFVLPVPSVDVRRVLEGERERRAASPRHPREREDAPPHVLRDLWRDVASLAPRLGIPLPDGRPSGRDAPPYDPAIYRSVFESLLRHRNAEIAALDIVLPTAAISVYDFDQRPADLVPTDEEADAAIREVERRYAGAASVTAEVARWWQV